MTVTTEITENNVVQLSFFDMFDQVKKADIDLDASQRLCFAIFAQAVKDAGSRDKNQHDRRKEAESWLLERGAFYLETLGLADLEFSQRKIETWIREGCVLTGPGRGAL